MLSAHAARVSGMLAHLVRRWTRRHTRQGGPLVTEMTDALPERDPEI